MAKKKKASRKATRKTNGNPAASSQPTKSSKSSVKKNSKSPTKTSGKAAVAAAPTSEPLADEGSEATGQPVDQGATTTKVAQETSQASSARKRLAAWRRLGHLSGLSITRGRLLAAGVTLLIGLALVAQVQSTQAGDLEELREEDLIALLDDVTVRADNLQDEVRRLESDRESLTEGDDVEAARAAESRLESYQILAGIVPVLGPGVEMVVRDPDNGLSTTAVIDMVQELRDGGAEAIQIGEVRVVASTWVELRPDALVVDGTTVDEPYRVLAIGDSHTLAGALAIPGGFTDNVRRGGGSITVTERDELQVDALHEPKPHQYAQPVP